MARKEKILAMLDVEPNDPFLHYALGQEYLSEGDRSAARTKLQEVVDRFPKYHAAHFQLAQLLAEDDEAGRAAEMIRDGIAAAREAGDRHAEMEMTEFLNSITG